jgi:hypothetical protein
MFISIKKYDELNARIVTLARTANKLKEKNEITEHNNTVLLEKNRQLEDTVKTIVKLVTKNDCNRPDLILAKIRDLVRDYQSKN